MTIGPWKLMNEMNPAADPVGAAWTAPGTAGHQPGPTQDGSGNPLPTSLEKRKYVQERAELIVHAIKCRRKEAENPSSNICTLAECRELKDVLTHMQSCQLEKNCPIRHCSSLKQVINHWKTCQRRECPLCLRDTNKYTQSQQHPGQQHNQQQQTHQQNQQNQGNQLRNQLQQGVGLDLSQQQQQPGQGPPGQLGQMPGSFHQLGGSRLQSPYPTATNSITGQPAHYAYVRDFGYVPIRYPESMNGISPVRLDATPATSSQQPGFSQSGPTGPLQADTKKQKKLLPQSGQVRKNCPNKDCFSSKLIVDHWKSCQRQDCSICSSLRESNIKLED